MKKLLAFLTCLLLLTSLQGQILRYSHYTAAPGGDTTNYYSVYKTIYDEMTTPPGHDTAHFQSAMVYSLDSMAMWGRIKLFYVFATAHGNSTYLNWANPGTYDLTDPGTTAPPFVAYQGLDADGSSDYLSTGWAAREDSTLVGLNSLTIASWQLADIDATYITIGVTDAGGIPIYIYPRTSSALRGRINVSATSSFSDPGSTIGFSMITRTDHNVLEGYFNGVSQGNDNDESNILPTTQTLSILAHNNNGTAANFFDGIVSIVLVMNGVTDAEELAIYNIIHHYMTHIGL